MRLAIFDLDGTLLVGSKNVMPDLAAILWRRGYRRVRGLPLLLVAGAAGLIRKLKLISSERYTFLGTRLLVRWMAGDRPADLTEYFRATVERQTARHSTQAALRRHQAAGESSLLVSAVIQPMLDLFGERFSCAAVGTPVELDSAGRLTGRLAGPFCSGAAKAAAVAAWTRGRAVDWAGSYAYGDTEQDCAMLALVGHPVAVAPAPGLRAEAVRHGWQVWEA